MAGFYVTLPAQRRLMGRALERRSSDCAPTGRMRRTDVPEGYAFARPLLQ
jgi:hypothetical protein